MADDFDPYQKWLGIPPLEQPPNFYRLLTLKPLESDLEVISKATTNLTAYLAARSRGKSGAHAIRLLDEVIAAGTCLLDPACKAVYDATLQTAGTQAAAEAVAKRPAATPQAAGPAIAAAILTDDTAAASEPLVDMSFLEGLGRPAARSALVPKLKGRSEKEILEDDHRSGNQNYGKLPPRQEPFCWSSSSRSSSRANRNLPTNGPATRLRRKSLDLAIKPSISSSCRPNRKRSGEFPETYRVLPCRFAGLEISF